VYVKNGFTVACVFDGTAHQLKQDQAYVSCYGKNEELKLEMEELSNRIHSHLQKKRMSILPK